jgi:hypothetical protein
MVSAVLGMLVLLPGSAFAESPGPDQYVLDAVQRSAEFQQVQLDNPDLTLRPSLSRTAREGDHAVAVQAFKDDTGTTTVVATHFVDMRTGDVKASRLGRIVVEEATGQDRARFGSSVKKTASVTMSTNGKVDFVGTVSDTGVLREDAGFKDFADQARSNAQTGCEECGTAPKASDALQEPPPVTAMGWCETTMNYLCGASGAFQCAIYCGALGVTPLGLGWAVLCGLIATWGCANTIDYVCG